MPISMSMPKALMARAKRVKLLSWSSIDSVSLQVEGEPFSALLLRGTGLLLDLKGWKPLKSKNRPYFNVL